MFVFLPSTEISWIAKRKIIVQIIPKVIFKFPSTISEMKTKSKRFDFTQLEQSMFTFSSNHQFDSFTSNEIQCFIDISNFMKSKWWFVASFRSFDIRQTSFVLDQVSIIVRSKSLLIVTSVLNHFENLLQYFQFVCQLFSDVNYTKR